ncbi:hypothetical protein AQUCO_01500125v1 [Aquilegia coerulea]|uniref:Phosphoribosyl-AMP cyclohydrolase domain-containing protein n=2 Tax=Aquilegia coerulea TaxID=218851 RepID=A0A2G5DS78_AQUCA|nr:hypothetical protein AQUCO_01500125v1 [Aquilegia coerulea]
MSILQFNGFSSLSSSIGSNRSSFQSSLKFINLSSPLPSPSIRFFSQNKFKGLVVKASVIPIVDSQKVETLLNSVKWDDKGLTVAIAQHVDTGAILMQAFANREALAATISSRKATFYSRSRSSLWTKGETSSNFINVTDIFLDCDRDSIIYLGKPDGPTCHTGEETCYYSSVDDLLKHPEVDGKRLALTTLYELESTISQRKAEIGAIENGKPSWTKKLLLDQKLLCSKIREEADELCRTLEENEDQSRTAAEAADLLFHSMVLLKNKDVKLEDVFQVLRQRFSQSGIEEKRSRKSHGHE